MATSAASGSDDTVRARLREEQAAARLQVEALEAQFDGFVEASELVATDDEHDPEGHTIAFERQQVAALLRAARLARLTAAFERLDHGTYDRCARCGAPIPAERLEALPGTDRCVACASA
jgi:RNA polymerase-binding transcription factor DksA